MTENAQGSGRDRHLLQPESAGGIREEVIPSVPGKGWNVMFRLYGPLQPWFDKTWQTDDVVLMK